MINNQNKPQEVDFKNLPLFDVLPEARAAILRDHQEHYLRPYKARMEKLVTICWEHHILPVLLTQPVLYGGGVDAASGVDLDHRFVAKDMDGATAWQVLELYNGVTREVGRERGVLVIDLAREMPKNSTYFYDPMHYTNAGAAKLADIIDAHLTPFLAAKFPSYYQGKATPPVAGP
jgi:hypothetical protein